MSVQDLTPVGHHFTRADRDTVRALSTSKARATPMAGPLTEPRQEGPMGTTVPEELAASSAIREVREQLVFDCTDAIRALERAREHLKPVVEHVFASAHHGEARALQDHLSDGIDSLKTIRRTAAQEAWCA